MIDLEKVVPLGKQILELRQNSDKDQVLGQVVEMIAQTLNLYFVGIYVVDSQKEKVILKAGSGEGGRIMVSHSHNNQIRDGYPKDERIWGFDAGTCAYSKEIQLVNRMIIGETSVFQITDGKVAETKNLNEHEIFWSPKLPHAFRELFLPLVLKDKVVGVLEINSSVNVDFTTDEVLMFNMLANHIVEVMN